jgi:hypothetical protein
MFWNWKLQPKPKQGYHKTYYPNTNLNRDLVKSTTLTLTGISVEAKVEYQQVKCLVDSGSNISCINNQYLGDAAPIVYDKACVVFHTTDLIHGENVM